MRAFFVMFLFLFNFSLIAQFDLSGTVKNESGEVLIGASVFLVSHDYATISDDQGYWMLKDVDDGLYTLKCTYLGYKSEEMYVEVIDDETIEIILTGSLFDLEEIVISANQLKDKDPFAHQNLSGKTIKEKHLVQDIPFLLQHTPSTVVTSDAGNGVGYTGIRVRGSDPSRVNVTINGVPLNDSESQSVFWVNLPDFAASAESIQIQRGVGTSSNGAGAFGASIGFNTNKMHTNPYAEFNLGYGSFNTSKINAQVGTGLMNDKYSVDFKYSKIRSDGYVDRASSDLDSWYFSAAKISDNSMLRFTTFTGHEVTYQSWYGVPIEKIEGSAADLQAHYQRNKGSIYKTTQDSINLFDSDRSYNYYTYDNQVDDYRQSHYQLMYHKKVNSGLKFNTNFHYTRGIGFFEEFRYQDDYADYGLKNFVDSTGQEFATSDIIRRRWLDNHFYGGVLEIEKNISKADIVFGGAIHKYIGDHYGNVVSDLRDPDVDFDTQYYLNRGEKLDYNVFAKSTYRVTEAFNLFFDLQYRGVDYTIFGKDNDALIIDRSDQLNFFNPKLGMHFNLADSTAVYASVAMANREPDRNDYVDLLAGLPKAERMIDYELGFRQISDRYSATANIYYMDYTDQLVLNGTLNDVGSTLRTNVDKSYRAGVELMATVKILDNLSWSPNVTISRNKIKTFEETIYDYGTDQTVVTSFDDTDISFSPSIISGQTLSYTPRADFTVVALGKYVGKQYLDNTSNEDRSLAAYFTTDLQLLYRPTLKKLKSTTVSILATNLLNSAYSSNGYTYSYDYNGDRTTERFLYPQAGLHLMGQVTFRF